MIEAEAERFTKLIAGDGEIFLRTFHDKDRNQYGHNWRGTWAQCKGNITADQLIGYGAYMVINAGGHSDVDIEFCRASFIDIDIYKGDPVPLLWHQLPHIICERRDLSGELQAMHAYWLLEPTASLDEWMQTQQHLAHHYGSDAMVFNPSRVMRIPGTLHLKAEPQLYRLAWVSDDLTRLTLPRLVRGLEPLPADYYLRKPATGAKRGTTLVEVDDEPTRRRVVSYLTGAEPAVEGDSGDAHTFAVAARCREEGLPLETTLQLMFEHWNPRCTPPWEFDDLAQKVANAYAYAQKSQGSANALALFAADVAPAVAGAVVTVEASDDDLSPVTPNTPTEGAEEGAGNYARNHAVNAAQFLISHYPGGLLIRTQDLFYTYNGKCWEVIDDDLVRHLLAVAMLGSNPSDGVINGTYGVLCKIIYAGNTLVLGQWAGDTRDTSQLIVYNNGMLDLATGELESHNRDFFNTTVLPYDYDPDAECPRWLDFVAEIFDHDGECIALLQEWLGYLLTPFNTYQKAMLLIGRARSGKGTIGRIIEMLVGSANFSGISLDGFAQDSVLEAMVDKRVLFVGDAHSVSPLYRGAALERLKSITGADQIAITRKYIGTWRGRLPGRITMAANDAPQFLDDSGAMAGRLLILPFNQSWLGRENFKLDKILGAEIAGINAWALQGLARLRADGFTKPAASEIEATELGARYSPLLLFVRECCVIREGGKIFGDQLYGAYRIWCVASGNKPQNRNNFTASMRAAFRGEIEKKLVFIEGKRAQGFVGLSLSVEGQSAAGVFALADTNGVAV